MFIEISTSSISTMLDYVKGLLGDLTPLLLIVLAIGLGVFIFWAIVSAIRG